MSRYRFPEWTEKFKLLVGLLVLGGPLYIGALAFYGIADGQAISIGYRPKQPVPYSHELHAGELGIDCRYCHDAVERSSRASIPPVKTCMNCHTALLSGSEALAPVRDAYDLKQNKPLRWVRVHDLPDYVYFNHSAHVVRGVGCESCHGRIDRMVEVYQASPLTMGWCLDCHRNPEQHLRDPKDVTMMGYRASGGDQKAVGERLRDANNINPPTNCSTCHR